MGVLVLTVQKLPDGPTGFAATCCMPSEPASSAIQCPRLHAWAGVQRYAQPQQQVRVRPRAVPLHAAAREAVALSARRRRSRTSSLAFVHNWPCYNNSSAAEWLQSRPHLIMTTTVRTHGWHCHGVGQLVVPSISHLRALHPPSLCPVQGAVLPLQITLAPTSSVLPLRHRHPAS